MKNNVVKEWLAAYPHNPFSNPECRSLGQDNIWRESQNRAICNGKLCRPHPTWMIHWDSAPHLIFPFKNCHGWAKLLELVLEHPESIFSPDSWLFWVKHLFFLLTFSFWIIGFWTLSSLTWVQWQLQCSEVCLFQCSKTSHQSLGWPTYSKLKEQRKFHI